MASKTSFEMVGNWSDRVDVGLGNAAAAAMDVIGWDGRKTCMKALVYMAMTAKANTQKAAKNRKVVTASGVNKNTGAAMKYKLVNWYRNGSTRVSVDFNFRPKDPSAAYDWTAAKEIHNRGLAQRSWFWAFTGKRRNINRVQAEIMKKAMPGVSTITEQISDRACGYILSNRLGYVTKIIPAGLEETAAKAATNRIMAQAARAVERKFGTEVPRLAAQRSERAARRKAKTLSQLWQEGQEQ